MRRKAPRWQRLEPPRAHVCAQRHDRRHGRRRGGRPPAHALAAAAGDRDPLGPRRADRPCSWCCSPFSSRYLGPATKYVRTLAARSSDARRRSGQLRDDNARLRRQAKVLKDPQQIELRARQLGMARPGERVYVVRGLPTERRRSVSGLSGVLASRRAQRARAEPGSRERRPPVGGGLPPARGHPLRAPDLPRARAFGARRAGASCAKRLGSTFTVPSWPRSTGEGTRLDARPRDAGAPRGPEAVGSGDRRRRRLLPVHARGGRLRRRPRPLLQSSAPAPSASSASPFSAASPFRSSVRARLIVIASWSNVTSTARWPAQCCA